MIAVVQRVKHSHVAIEGEIVGSCEKGLMVLLGVAAEDDEMDASVLCQKLVKLRIFTDENDKMNLSVRDVGGEMLVVSQFTLLADTSHGNRPSFIGAARPELAEPLCEALKQKLEAEGIHVETGRFQTHMEVELVNDGPVTILLDSKKNF